MFLILLIETCSKVIYLFREQHDVYYREFITFDRVKCAHNQGHIGP